MSAGDLLVSVRGLRKEYRLGSSSWSRFADALLRRSGREGKVALADVSFDLQRGQSLGIVGHNGAGKSTLLKILAGVVAPTAGEALVNGRVSSILELGSGFHPDFTGRQNLRLNAAMLGLSEEEVERRRPQIEEFCELGEFLDQPLKIYSTGMVMRLAFAIATQVEPDILIVDEALSVGDGYFQKKCMDRLRELTDGGTALLFCSHAMYYVTSFCDRALWLENGVQKGLGPSLDVVAEYEDSLLRQAPGATATSAVQEGAVPSGEPASFVEVSVRVPEAADGAFRTGSPWRVDLRWRSEDADRPFHVGLGVNRADGVEVFTLTTRSRSALRGQRDYSAHFELESLPLTKGTYTIYAFLLDEESVHVYDRVALQDAFRVGGDDYAFGLFDVPHHFELHKGGGAPSN